MGVGETVYGQLHARKEEQRQYRLGFMPAYKKSSRFTLTLDLGDTRISVVTDDLGPHGLMLQSLRITATGGQPDPGIQAGFSDLVDKIKTGLVCPYGPVSCVESDVRKQKALLRTEPDAEGCYIEIMVSGDNEAELKHFTVSQHTRERNQDSVNLGRRVFEKMVDSFALAFDGQPVETEAV